MAKAITRIERHTPNQTDEQAQAMQRMVQSAANSSDPLLKGLDILNELDKLGVLDAARAMLKNSRQIAEIGMGQLNKPGAHHIMKNGMAAIGFLSALEPAKLQALLGSVAAGVDHAVDTKPAAKREGLWSTLGRLRDPEVIGSLSMMTRFLQGMGRSLNKTR